MARTERTFFVQAPTEQVVAYLADLTNAPEWDPRVQSAQPVGGDGVQTGATWRGTAALRGGSSQMDFTLERCESGRVTVVGRSPKATVTRDFEVTDQRGGSRITMNNSLSMAGWAKVLAPLTAVDVRRTGLEAEEGIKEAISGTR